ncbi:hypothetical protein [Pandoraea communis]|uniref:hypothetical protein n=1 Tax=Pandoraea communis TaxID=2508297 RepID=UPI00123F1921|nr:hypothetical protein [Pandoraea communis]
MIDFRHRYQLNLSFSTDPKGGNEVNALTKVVCYAGLLLMWGFFAFTGKTPVEGFITAISAALAALAATHVAAAGADRVGGSAIATLGVSSMAEADFAAPPPLKRTNPEPEVKVQLQ